MKLVRTSLIIGLSFFINIVADAKYAKSNITNTTDDQSNSIPSMIIKTITNTSPYSLMLIDKFNGDKSFIINPDQTLEVNLKVESSKSMVTNNDTINTVCKKAQFLIKKVNTQGKPEFGKKLYFNTHLVPDNSTAGGSFIINGVNITKKMFNPVTANFFIINKGILTTYSYFYTCNTQINKQYDVVEIDITLSSKDEDIKNNIFLLRIEGNIFPYEKTTYTF